MTNANASVNCVACAPEIIVGFLGHVFIKMVSV